jgi:hypothetical protein
MFTKLIAKLLKKKLYKSNVHLTDEEFTANYYSNCILSSLKWTLHGIYESSNFRSSDMGSKKYIYGQICEFKILSINNGSIVFFDYTKPRSDDFLFMSNNMVYIPENILKIAKKSKLHVSDFLK